MSSEQMQTLARSKRAANENFRKRVETLGSKFTELSQDYEADVYFLVYRNGRFHTYSSTDNALWPPSPETLSKLYPPPIKKSLAHYRRIKPQRAKVNSRKAILHKRLSAGCSLTSAQSEFGHVIGRK
ncbi:hypothetical protein K469DRAFT_789526 [Zopfia rhizophila CBS 207.26]|uniref:MADS-box domain-containing protein n=1 Tax=Zopfia rhizophila CBS 207.26 TaxID=1314779 RepID=A0A6A6ERE1_9PEZI|nr:hypothetical protein K469DRAFT_789526 [Zopfia rhizophila CBS 207.26]